MTSSQNQPHTYSCAVTHSKTRALSHASLDKNSETVYDSSNLKPFDLWHLCHIVLVLQTWLSVYFYLFMNNYLDVHACRNYHSYLSMIAHMSRLTFSKAPIVPFSTACKSAGWSSTKIACMQPWKERWEGGNSVWRKYPEANKRNKPKMKLYYTVSESWRWINWILNRIWEGTETTAAFVWTMK